MKIPVRIAPAIQDELDIPETVEVEGGTIGQCIDDLVRQYPGIKSWLFDWSDMMRVLVSINNEEMISLQTEANLNRALNPSDEIFILAIVSGG